MDRETARVVVTENLNKQPSEFDKNFEALFANEHFGDVVTEVFPDTLDPHSQRGQRRLKKYADLASFLNSEANAEEARFVAVKVQTINAEYRHDNIPPRQTAEALVLYSFAALSTDKFRVVRDAEGVPLSIAVDHPAKVYGFGFSNGAMKSVQETVVIDSIDSITSAWTRTKDELQTPSNFIVGTNAEELDYKARQLDRIMGIEFASPIAGAMNDVLTDDFRVKVGLETAYHVATK